MKNEELRTILRRVLKEGNIATVSFNDMVTINKVIKNLGAKIEIIKSDSVTVSFREWNY